MAHFSHKSNNSKYIIKVNPKSILNYRTLLEFLKQNQVQHLNEWSDPEAARDKRETVQKKKNID